MTKGKNTLIAFAACVALSSGSAYSMMSAEAFAAAMYRADAGHKTRFQGGTPQQVANIMNGVESRETTPQNTELAERQKWQNELATMMTTLPKLDDYWELLGRNDGAADRDAEHQVTMPLKDAVREAIETYCRRFRYKGALPDRHGIHALLTAVGNLGADTHSNDAGTARFRNGHEDDVWGADHLDAQDEVLTTDVAPAGGHSLSGAKSWKAVYKFYRTVLRDHTKNNKIGAAAADVTNNSLIGLYDVLEIQDAGRCGNNRDLAAPNADKTIPHVGEMLCCLWYLTHHK